VQPLQCDTTYCAEMSDESPTFRRGTSRHITGFYG
jgi:hypothetical protein